MSNLIGIFSSHKEQVVSTNADYTVFFDFLSLLDYRIETIEKELDENSIKNYAAIMLGEPHSVISKNEIGIINQWIDNGGRFLIFASMGGDSAPSGNSYSQSNINALIKGIVLNDNTLGIDKGVFQGNPFDTKVIVDISEIKKDYKICYDTGCTFVFNNQEYSILNKLLPPRNSKSVEGVRILFNKLTIKNPYPQNAEGLIYLHLKKKLGEIILIGSSFIVKNDTIIRENNIFFVNYLLSNWLPNFITREITENIAKPQRHRLLHGYPMPALMHNINDNLNKIINGISIDRSRNLLIGILPHAFCNPTVKGCGFCTFPHEMYNANAMDLVVKNVSKEIELFVKSQPDFQNRIVSALYFGGGTANLTKENLFLQLCEAISNNFIMDNCEITLEGVPKYFITNKKLLEIIKTISPKSKLRISIGIQSFNEKYLALMGRSNFGDFQLFKDVIKIAKELNYNVSCDLLFNLPSQSLRDMIDDIQKAINLGFNQICLYHLVLFRNLGTEWSKDKDLLSKLPDNNQSCENWIGLRDILINSNYRQTTLTNFELIENINSKHNFIYERSVMSPEKYDWIGFGPSAISLVIDKNFDRAIKFTNPTFTDEYNTICGKDSFAWDKFFIYNNQDLKILYITRKIASLKIDLNEYSKIFKSDIQKDFKFEIQSLENFEFIIVNENEILITPKGNFYADTVAGIFAFQQILYSKMLNKTKGLKQKSEESFYHGNYARHHRMG